MLKINNKIVPFWKWKAIPITALYVYGNFDEQGKNLPFEIIKDKEDGEYTPNSGTCTNVYSIKDKNGKDNSYNVYSIDNDIELECY